MAGLLDVPKEIKVGVARFLEAHDVVQLSCSCRVLREELVLRPLTPPTQYNLRPPSSALAYQAPHTHGRWIRAISPPLTAFDLDAHSLKLVITYRSNWETPSFTSKVLVTAYPAAGSVKPLREMDPGKKDDLQRLGRIVVRGAIHCSLEQYACQYSLQWTPQRGEIYYVWYQTPMIIDQLTLQTTVFDQADTIVSQQYAKLFHSNMIAWHHPAHLVKLHLGMVRGLKAKWTPAMAARWHNKPGGETTLRLPSDPQSLSVIENILQAFWKMKELQIRHAGNAE